MTKPEILRVRGDTDIAFRHDGPKDMGKGVVGLFWLGGFMSDMEGSKAQTLADLAVEQNRPCLRFDYSGHGSSGGKFTDGTISKWLEESVLVFKHETKGPRVIIGSSMGGWLAMLLYRHFIENDPEVAQRIVGIVLIAPAADMTEKLMWNTYSTEVREEMKQNGFYAEPSQYGDEPYIITKQLIDDGRQHSLMDKGLRVSSPARILQGEKDPDVPWQHGLDVYRCIEGDDVAFTLIKSGDHRLSGISDLVKLRQTCQELFELAARA